MIDLVRLLCPYPTIDDDGKLMDGFLVTQPNVCRKCADKLCRDMSNGDTSELIMHKICAKGLSCLLVRSAFGTLTCNGILLKEHNLSCPPQLRKQIQENKIALAELQRWYQSLMTAIPVIEGQAGKNVVDAVNSLHDVTTGVSLVMRNAEAIITTLPGDTDEARIEGAPDQLKSLLKSVQLLHRRLLMPSYVTNPQSASHGQKRRTPIYKIFHRMVRLFEQLAAKKNVQIRMGGYSIATPPCYESFETIALILIDNAIKYSIFGGIVTVLVSDTLQGAVHVMVGSDGPPVPEDMRSSIFEPRVRAPRAKEFAATGSGLGLYIAKVVADAHQVKISYTCTGLNADGKIGHNVFAFDIGP